jgi:hypothetical protein
MPFAATCPDGAEAGQPSGQGNDEFASKHAGIARRKGRAVFMNCHRDPQVIFRKIWTKTTKPLV